MQVTTLAELKAAAKEGADEILITDPGLAYRVGVYNTIRTVSNVLVFVILALALFAWADPFHFQFLKTDGARLGRQIMLGFGLLLLFVEYVLPVVRQYRIVGKSESGLKLEPRRRK